jgi:hypothetical protein
MYVPTCSNRLEGLSAVEVSGAWKEAMSSLEESQATKSIERAAVRHAINLQVAMMIAVVLWLFFAVGASLLAGLRPDVTHVATLARMHGSVDILVAGSDTWQSVEVGTQIKASTRVRTGPDAAAQLAFFDGSTTDLASNTEVSVAQMSSRRKGGGKIIVLQQRLGQTYHRVQPLLDADSRFEVETPSAVASVRGTEFALDVGADGATLVVVVEGLVNVKAQEVTVPVEAGHGTVARPQQPPEPARPASTLPVRIETLEPPGQTKTPQPPGQTKTPEPPGQTKTPQPPGQTKTPQPPGQTKTPEPPGQTKTPQPPGQDKTPKPKPPKPPKKPKK